GLALLLGFASWPYHPRANPVRALHAILVQPDTPLAAAWSARSLTRFLAQQSRLSRPALGSPAADLIIWPEQPAPLNYAAQPEFQASTAELLARTRAAFLFGEVSYDGADAPRNSALLIHADGTTGQRYDKRHLVPFGEYVPLPRWFERVAGVGKLVQEVGDFVPGKAPVLFHLQGHAFSTLICYESIFPALARRDVLLGAEWLVNQSDDSWYGRSSAAAQGLMMAQVRAMENRRWLLRDTNDGLTAVIDPYGRITAALPRFRAAALDAGFSPETRLTFYTRHGDWLAWLCCLVAAAWGVGAGYRYARPDPPPSSADRPRAVG
ncbi:MAG: apolipoprotein N-acyltransferase, partial [Terriglobales bacterium]